MQAVHDFVEYIPEEYVYDGCKFPPSTWAAYDRNQIRTTNACEAFDSKLNAMFYHAHPHIFQLIEALFEMQNMSYLKMQSTDDVKIGQALLPTTSIDLTKVISIG